MSGKKALLFALFNTIFIHMMYAKDSTTITSLLQKEKLSGVVWALVKEDSIITFSAGFKHLKKKELMHPADQVHVGSITKTILALGILRLTTINKIHLDDPINKYLSDLPIFNQWGHSNPVTIRHLLDHTSGLSDLRLWHFFSTSSNPTTALNEFYKINPEVLRIQKRPGEMFSYSNMGYTILGMLIEKVTNEPYEKFLDNNLLEPIGMHNSTFEFTSQTGNFLTSRLAMGHFDDGNQAPALPIYLRPAGQFTTTAFDMGILIKFFLNKGKIRGTQFIDSSFFDTMGHPHYTKAFENGLSGGYSFGLLLRDRHGVVGLAHSGNIIGYRAMIYIFPNENKGFFISHNMDSESADYEAFNKALIDKLDIPTKRNNSKTGIPVTEFKEWQGYYIPAITKVEPFKLLDIAGSFTRLKLTENGMTMTPFQKNETKLLHIGNGLFQSAERTKISHVLYKDENGMYLTSGISTMQKINGWYLGLIGASMAAGLVAIIVVLISGIYQIFKHKTRIFQQPIFWAFTGIIFLIISIIQLSSNNIIYIGDKNAGSIFLYVTSFILPISTLISVVSYYMSNKEAFKSIGFWSTIFLLQLLILCFYFGLVPFSTWK